MRNVICVWSKATNICTYSHKKKRKTVFVSECVNTKQDLLTPNKESFFHFYRRNLGICPFFIIIFNLNLAFFFIWFLQSWFGFWKSWLKLWFFNLLLKILLMIANVLEDNDDYYFFYSFFLMGFVKKLFFFFCSEILWVCWEKKYKLPFLL